ncbi:hypothetical protein [Nostoc punctiforme]|uniref:Uncharacterized protein n=1 Tax=Nostoc punctiforme (strain ATCC 29133 / PCC 73102) TaxID=63737 RepID=B2JB30_NOSP7|nr:hypothetical protein [Nostoc punctiforme]ACC85134.1 hypothetical protein Npun_AF279 [Nostoc punctiforme PCC 73102]
METIKINNSVFLIPPSQPKLQANCAKEYGQFLLDCPPKLTILEAQAGGYLKGNKADFAMAYPPAVGDRNLSSRPCLDHQRELY